jgi:hypothetical protein
MASDTTATAPKEEGSKGWVKEGAAIPKRRYSWNTNGRTWSILDLFAKSSKYQFKTRRWSLDHGNQ